MKQPPPRKGVIPLPLQLQPAAAPCMNAAVIAAAAAIIAIAAAAAIIAIAAAAAAAVT